MITLRLTERDVEVIRMALRSNESQHQRNDFKALVLESQDLRSKIADAIIDSNKAVRESV